MQPQQRLPLVSWEHFFVDVTKEEHRFSALHAYLTTCVRPGERVIIFRTHGPKAQKTAMILRALGHNAAPLIGRMSDTERARTIQMFNGGQLSIIVCTEIAVVSHSQQQHWNRADHIIMWSFHWSSPAANSREYIARSDKGNGRIVSFVTIADSVTLQHLNSSLGFKMREVELDDKIREDAKVLLDSWTGKEEMIKNKEQEKLSAFLSTSVPSPSSTLMTSTGSSVSAVSSSQPQPSQGQQQQKRVHNPHELGALPSPAEAMANINAVMKQYRSIGNSMNDDDDDDSSTEDDSSDESDSESASDDDDHNNNAKRSVGFMSVASTPKKMKTEKNKLSASKKKNNKTNTGDCKSSPVVPSSNTQRDDGTNVSPNRQQSASESAATYRRSNSLPRANDHHGLHSHVSLPSYSNNTNNNNRSSPIVERNASSTKRSASRGKAAASKGLCLPRQVDHDTGKFVQDHAPFVARPGEEQLVEMIEAEMNLGHLNTKFDDIAGQARAKALLEEAVIFPTLLPGFFKDTRRAWKGVLMYGPPGTGKTLLAKAVATTAKTTFFNVSPATLTSKWRGESERLIRVLFEMARHYAPSTIFIDECDSLCGSRGGATEHEASRRAKSMLLQEMDGLQSDPSKNVVVLGATNHPWAIDEAMRRRFEQRIYIGLPTKCDRESLFKLNTRSILLSPDVNSTKLAQMLEGKFYSGADITTLIRDAAMRPMRRYMYGTSSHGEGGLSIQDSKKSSSLNNSNSNKISIEGLLDDDNNNNNDSKSEAATLELMEKRRKELYRNPQELEEKLSKLPVTMNDFLTAMKAVPSSVNADQIQRFEEWQKLFAS